MSNTDWRTRLTEAIERDGRSDRAICAAIGRSGSYLNGILKGGKEPGIESMLQLAKTLNISLSWLMFGVELDGDAEQLLKLFTSLSAKRRKSFLQMAEAVVSAADEKQ